MHIRQEQDVHKINRDCPISSRTTNPVCTLRTTAISPTAHARNPPSWDKVTSNTGAPSLRVRRHGRGRACAVVLTAAL